MEALFKVLVEIEGETYALEDCEWVWFHKCGCPFGCSHAETADEEAAWKGMFYYAKERVAHRRKGVTAQLVTKAKWAEEIMPKMLPSYTCPHTV